MEAKKPKSTPAASALVSPQAKTRRVLIFDDDLVVRLAGMDFVQIDLRLERSADDAENVVAVFSPALVLMDHHLAGSARMGDEAVVVLRSRWNKDKLPIIGVSSSPAGNAALLRAGANATMLKGAVLKFLRGGACLKTLAHQ